MRDVVIRTYLRKGRKVLLKEMDMRVFEFYKIDRCLRIMSLFIRNKLISN